MIVDNEVRHDLLTALKACLESVVEFTPRSQQSWYPEATTSIMKRVERLHDVLQKRPERFDNDANFLIHSYEAKLYLDWLWGTDEEGAEDFDVVFFGDEFAQECSIKMKPTM